ncbi:hypothetical protein [Methylobacillus flagellatus]|uniref:Lipoprotein n=1 Tax=Methylobacillus flagellatus (strain ATCC 51484 / DSM 6875 / VKM B-1610 / KT) TaxID=265072 RepID=Q1H066_METFK|nr:hypothetical protein [Methylobacillus flagellatus]ABE50121.1 hypothetical protein Mfla_1854 [Methylobacillus flagellatus KT]
MLRTWLWAVPLAALLILTACVTINIYFPAAAAEKAADRIIDDVWQLKDKTLPSSPEQEENQ